MKPISRKCATPGCVRRLESSRKAAICTLCSARLEARFAAEDALGDAAALSTPLQASAAEWPEQRADIIGQNGPTGEHYAQGPAGHYHHVIRAPISDADIARGYTEARLDPYRVCDVYRTGGGPREQMIKKLLRWTDKGQSEEQVIGEIESALTRWKEMRKEDAACR